MSFIETPRFPDKIAYGAIGGPEYQTEIVVRGSGFEQRNINWDVARARYQIALQLERPDKDLLLDFFRSTKGRAHGFRLRDWSDYQATVATGRLGTSSVGTGVPAYQLHKLYAAGALSEYRKITKPVAGTITIYRGGVLQAAGGGLGNYAIDTTTGIVTFIEDATSSVTGVTIAGSAVITLAGALSGLIAGNGRLYLTGVGGTVGNVLNGVAHVVTGVSGAQYTIATSTIGLVYTSGGTGRKYAQPAETLAWAGEFDVPVRFDVDYPGLSIEGPGFWRATSINLVEIRV